MDGNPPDEPDGSAAAKAKLKGWPSAALEQDKKTVFWMGGVMECFSTVLSLFNKTDLSPTKEDDWEVPFTDLSEFLYLGAGAQGIVFRGNLKGEMVAVKKLRERSETNIKHLRKLDHQNIVRFRGVSTNGPVPCIIMEYCQYGPLFEFLHSGACITANQTFRWAKDIALGMAYLHSNKIIHRDLKSPNILIADNLVVKVSDFGTAREWDDVSAIMSFTGTVAWMAPEVIRHEPCSERVDVWSYGVVLWELLTQEVPYKNLETHAIMWGVGTDTLSLPIPSSCPDNLQILLQQCWSRTPRNRPPFKIIAANLESTAEQFAESHGDCFSATQVAWRKEIKEDMQFVTRPTLKPELGGRGAGRRDDARNARDARYVYEQQLNRANELYMEVCTIRLQLEQKEKDLAEREKALQQCRCGVRKNIKNERQTSTSSDNVMGSSSCPNDRRKKKSNVPAQLVVTVNSRGEKTVSVAVSPDQLSSVLNDVSLASVESAKNNNISTVKKASVVQKRESSVVLKDSFIEANGNVVASNRKVKLNDNHIPDIAQV
ncbi:mitogen-activated protein kinase kinase kinase 12-like [Anticarsia gemmatalis]|uniref:mitogen-activated protein kinase kinase kinase 12-like n=1 Tax=Anticarsia gemmatalis TaxID=129554 RepID=UPI003F775BF5